MKAPSFLVLATLLLAGVACENKPQPGNPSASASTSASASASKPDPDNAEGCPCGCDRSKEMVTSLALAGDDTARGAVELALETIAEREHAGYITEAMIQHRLRLRTMRPEVTVPAAVLPAPRATAENATVRVATELIVHGETTELVNGRDKLLPSCFLLRMEIENRSGDAKTFEPPVIEADVPLPVSRWYVAGSDGEPWTGTLMAGEKKLVHVIGYAGQPIAPTTVLDAAITFASVAVDTKVEARRRWNDVP